MPVCGGINGCGRDLPDEAFGKNSARPNGLAAYCSECFRYYDSAAGRAEREARRRSRRGRPLRIVEATEARVQTGEPYWMTRLVKYLRDHPEGVTTPDIERHMGWRHNKQIYANIGLVRDAGYEVVTKPDPDAKREWGRRPYSLYCLSTAGDEVTVPWYAHRSKYVRTHERRTGYVAIKNAEEVDVQNPMHALTAAAKVGVVRVLHRLITKLENLDVEQVA